MPRPRAVDAQDMCQGGFGHAWFPASLASVEFEVPDWAADVVVKRCERCDKEDVVLFDANGEWFHNYIDPPHWRKHNIVRRIDVARAVNAKPVGVKRKRQQAGNVVPIRGRRKTG